MTTGRTVVHLRHLRLVKLILKTFKVQRQMECQNQLVHHIVKERFLPHETPEEA